MADERRDSVRSRVEPFFDALLERDGAGGSWLPGLLGAAPRGSVRLGELTRAPGWLEVPLAVRTADGRRGAFTYAAAPPRELLGWYIDHPQALTRLPDASATPETERLRRALFDDEPPGVRARAQERAHDLLRRGTGLSAAWWRFEEAATLDCALLTDRLVLVVHGRRDEPAEPATPWFPARETLVRDLEAARRLAGGRPWGVILLSDHPLADGDAGGLAQSVERGSPQLPAPERAELAAGYLGNLTWADAADAAGVDLGALSGFGN